MSDQGTSKRNKLTDNSQWSTNDKIRLLHAVKYMVNDKTSCKLVKSFIKWENIKIDGKSAEECETMYQTLTGKVRKFRTIKEVTDDALTIVNRPRKSTARETNFSAEDVAEEQLEESKTLVVKKRRGRPSARSKSVLKCPGMPKRPLAAISLFIKDRSKELPLIRGPKSMTLFAKEWNKLPKEKKKIYQKKASTLYKEYNEQLKIVRQIHLDEPSTKFKQSKAKRTECPGMPKRPLAAISLFIKDRSKELPLIRGPKSMTLFAKEWNKLPKEKKKIYQKKASTLYKEYNEQLKIVRQIHFDEPSTKFKQSKAKRTEKVLQTGKTKKTKKKATRSTVGLDIVKDMKVELFDQLSPPVVIFVGSSDDNDDSVRSSENAAPVKRKSKSHEDTGIPQKKGKDTPFSQTVATHTDSKNPPGMPESDTGPQNPIAPAQNNEQHMDPVLPQNKRMHETISETSIVPAQNDALDEAILPSMRTPPRTNDSKPRSPERTTELSEQNNDIDFNAYASLAVNELDQIFMEFSSRIDEHGN